MLLNPRIVIVITRFLTTTDFLKCSDRGAKVIWPRLGLC